MEEKQKRGKKRLSGVRQLIGFPKHGGQRSEIGECGCPTEGTPGFLKRRRRDRQISVLVGRIGSLKDEPKTVRQKNAGTKVG